MVRHGPNKLKHLEMIQGVVNRLASNSFSIKQWTVALVSALFVLAVRADDYVLLLISLVPVLAFWFLDSYYLWQERLFRTLYADISVTEESMIDFSMKYRNTESYWDAFFSTTLLIFYCLLVTLVLLVSAYSLLLWEA